MASARQIGYFGDRMIALLPQLMQEIARYESNYVTSGKITCQQFLALSKITEQHEWKMNELAKAMKLSFPAMTGLIDRLIKHKLVKRSRASGDRRIVSIAITPKGKSIVNEVFAQKRRGLMEIFGKLSATERRRYLDILEKLVEKLSSNA